MGGKREGAFARVKEELCSAIVLELPDHCKLFILTTNRSQKGLGAVMSQLDMDGVKYPMAYASRRYNPVEHNNNSFDKECLVVVWASIHFRQ